VTDADGPRILSRMVIAAALCLCAAIAVAGTGMWLLARPRSADPLRQTLRAVAPTQLAAAVMLAAGGVVALAGPPLTGALAVAACVVGAVATVAAGCWQSAKAMMSGPAVGTPEPDCAGSCASCVLSCR
jgi:hypothetical protein